MAVRGLSFAELELEYEDRHWLLVYDRETSVPEDGTGAPPIDRQFKYAAPLPFDDVSGELASAVDMKVKDDLLFVAQESKGIAVLTLANPERPNLVRVIDQGTSEGGIATIDARSIDFVGGAVHAWSPAATTDRPSLHWVFDATRPSTPVLEAYETDAGARALIPGSSRLVTSAEALDLRVFRAEPPLQGVELRAYDPRGFRLARDSKTMAVSSSRGLTVNAAGAPFQPLYLTLFDPGGVSGVELVDALRVPPNDSATEEFVVAELASQGVLVAATVDRLLFVDTLILDVASSQPSPGEAGVPLGRPIYLDMTRPVDPALLTELMPYVELALIDGSESGTDVPVELRLVAGEPYRIEVAPLTPLVAQTAYELRLYAEPGSRRTMGLFEDRIGFTTATDAALAPEIVSVDPTVVDVGGGSIDLVVREASAQPLILVAGQPASIDASESLPDGSTRFTLSIPRNTSGPAAIEVTNANGASASRLGAVRYLPALRVESVSPAKGSINGGNWVQVQGSGFPAGEGELSVSFGNTLLSDENVRPLHSELIEVRAPPGLLGTVSVTVRTVDGQRVTLNDAYSYEQPIQTNISLGTVEIYDLVVDPTGVYAVAAAGSDGVIIYNIDPSSISGDFTEADLRGLIDEDGDEIDDRILAVVQVPGAVYAVDTYFERGVDRVIATGRGADGQSSLNIINFEPGYFDQTTVIGQLSLPGDFSRAVDAENSRALVALADGGIGLVDIFLATEPYLQEAFSLPGGQKALDVVRLERLAGQSELYAVAAGSWDLVDNELLDSLNPDSGGFYLISHDPLDGFQVVGTVPVPSSAIAVDGDLVYLAAGEAGVVIVDISDPANPRIIRRVDDIGAVHDVSVNGNTLYLAQGQQGVTSVDVSDPSAPMVALDMESFGSDVRVVVGGDYTAIGAGTNGSDGVVQVTPDVVLKVFRVDPQNGLVDRNALNEERIVLRFNKAIDLWEPNLSKFDVLDSAGVTVPHSVSIVGNDATLTLTAGHGLQPGEELTATAQAGIASIKPISETETITLFTLEKTQTFELAYRGARPEPIEIDAIVPRRLPAGAGGTVTLTALGVPADLGNVRVFVGPVEVPVVGLQSAAQDQSAAVVLIDMPPIVIPGQYDVVLQIERDGVWEQDELEGGLVIDAPIRFDSIRPKWGPYTGGTIVTIEGQGFEPGNTVSDGLSVRVGDVPVRSIEVVSTTLMRVVTAGGIVGPNGVFGRDRYGNETALTGEGGFGYGLRRLAEHLLPVSPTEVYVDQESGVAIANGGRFHDGNYADLLPDSTPLVPDVIQAVSIDIQDPDSPLLVGGASTVDLLGAGFEQALQTGTGISGQDAIGLAVQTELEGGVPRKRAYVANGGAGASRLNLDEQNGLQLIAQEGAENNLATAVSVSGAVAAIARAKPGTCKLEGECDTCQAQAGPAEASILSLVSAEDPVAVSAAESNTGDPLNGANVMWFDGLWLWNAGSGGSYLWGSGERCPFNPGASVRQAPTGPGASTVRALNLFEGGQMLEYAFDWNVHDVLTYGDYLIAALGNGGISIVNRDRSEIRTTVPVDAQLQASPGAVVRLRRFGNLLFASALGGGVVVFDMTDPLEPEIVSAGNDEHIEDIDYRKGRIVAISSTGNISSFELPGSVVVATSVDEQGWIADSEDYEITFNEFVTIDSVASGAVRVERLDTQENVPAFVLATRIEGEASDRFAVDFARTPGVDYAVYVDRAENLRSGGLWRPFVGHVRAASAGATRPRIDSIEGGVFHRGDNQQVTVHGAGFRNDPAVAVYVGNQQIPHTWVDANTLALAPGAVDLLEPGLIHIRVEDQELHAAYAGAIVMGEEIASATLTLGSDSGSVLGGEPNGVTANADVILPGSRIILRGRTSGLEIATELTPEGAVIRDLEDDVKTLTSFSFIQPGVPDPEIFDVYLRSGSHELFAGSYAYSIDGGRSLDLPNYPPMEIGAGQVVGDLFYVGVSAGRNPSRDQPIPDAGRPRDLRHRDLRPSHSARPAPDGATGDRARRARSGRVPRVRRGRSGRRRRPRSGAAPGASQFCRAWKRCNRRSDRRIHWSARHVRGGPIWIWPRSVLRYHPSKPRTPIRLSHDFLQRRSGPRATRGRRVARRKPVRSREEQRRLQGRSHRQLWSRPRALRRRHRPADPRSLRRYNASRVVSRAVRAGHGRPQPGADTRCASADHRGLGRAGRFARAGILANRDDSIGHLPRRSDSTRRALVRFQPRGRDGHAHDRIRGRRGHARARLDAQPGRTRSDSAQQADQHLG